MPAPAMARRAQLGEVEVDLRAGELWRGGRRVRLPGKPFEVLRALLDAEGEVVLREELFSRLWPDKTYFDFDNNLNSAVATLRDALGDDAEAPRYVETLPKRGYRLLVPVRWTVPERGEGERERPGRNGAPPPPAAREGVSVGSARVDAEQTSGPTAALAPAPAGLAHAARRQTHRAARWGVAALVLLAAAAGISLALARASRPDDVRLAVLPIADLSSPAGEPAFAAGLTEDLIAALGRRLPERFVVIAPASIAEVAASSNAPLAAAERLRVGYLLRATVRREGEAVRLTAQLLRPGDGVALWTVSFDRPLAEMLAVQAELASRLADSLALELADRATPTVAPAAYEAFLRGRYLLQARHPGAVRQAHTELQRAVALDGSFAAAQAALAESWSRLPAPPSVTMPRAEQAARRALELDPELAEGHHRLGQIAVYYRHDWAAGGRHLQRARELAPTSSTVLQSLAALHSLCGRGELAAEAMRHAMAVDPLAATVAADAGWYHFVARRHRRAVAQAEAALQLDPGHSGAHFYRLLAHEQLGDAEAAQAAALAYMRAARAAAGELATVAAVGGTEGLLAFHRWNLRRHQAQAREGYQSPGVQALDHLALGDERRALDLLERANAERSGWLLPFLAVYPPLDPLRDEPRFQRLLAELRLPCER